MKIYITCEFSLGIPLSPYGSQKIGAILERGIKSSKHDVLSNFSTTIDQHDVIAVGSMQENYNRSSNNQKPYNRYHVRLLNFPGVEVSKPVPTGTE
jgi:hypothetical protein